MISLSFIEVIILTACAACLCSTNWKTYPYKSPALKIKKSSKFKRFQLIAINHTRFQLIAINHTSGLARQKSTETINTLFEIIKRTLESSEDVLSPDERYERPIGMDEFGVRYPVCEKTGCLRLNARIYFFITLFPLNLALCFGTK